MAADADSTRGLTLVLDDEIQNTEVTEEYDDDCRRRAPRRRAGLGGR